MPLKPKQHTNDTRLKRKWLAAAIAMSISASSASVFAQSFPQDSQEDRRSNTSGDLPSSPWSNRDVRQAANHTLGGEQRGDRINLGPGSRQPASREPASQSSTSAERSPARLAPVTLMGPMTGPAVPKKSGLGNRASRKTGNSPSGDSSASSSNSLSTHASPPMQTRTQNPSFDPQSNRQRLQPGGIALPDLVSEEQIAMTPSQSFADEQGSTWESESNRQGLPDVNTDANRVTRSQMTSSPSSARSASARKDGHAIKLRGTHESTFDHGDSESAFEQVPDVSQGHSDSEPAKDSRTESHFDSKAKVAEPLRLEATAGTAPPYRTQELQSQPVATRSPSMAAAMTASNEQDELKMQRVDLAQRLSYEILSSNPYPAARPPESLEVPIGWDAIKSEMSTRLERCDSLLKRGAVLSARDEAIQGLRRVCKTMDAHRRSPLSAPALEKALAALREEADFDSLLGGGKPEVVASLVGSHSTEALKGRPLQGISAEIASQHYRTFARYQFVVAADGHQWVSDLLYAYGKTLEKEAESDPERAIRLRNQAVACYQSATQISPSQNDAANQLGYALIHLDRIDEAYGALTASIQQRPTANAWNNLAEIYRRRGAMTEADYAIQQAASIAETNPSFSYDNPEVAEVDPTTFARYSPMPAQLAGSANNAQPNNNSSAVRPASSTGNFFSKIFKK
jgi:tetratricopeptide (TPR) repeat protein